MRHLNSQGFLIVTRWLSYPPHETLRLLSLALTVDPQAQRTALFRSWMTTTLVIGRDKIPKERFQNFIKKNHFDVIYAPHIYEPNKYARFPTPVYSDLTRKLLKNPQKFYDSYYFDVSPVNDNRPFYSHFLKLGKMNEYYQAVRKNWQVFLDPGFLLVFISVQALLLSMGIICLPLLVRRTKTTALKGLAFFFFIGLGYLFVEIILISRLTILFPHTAYSAGIVIPAMLFFSSLGSYCTKYANHKTLFYGMLLICCTIFLYAFMIPGFIDAALTLNLSMRTISTILFLAPLAFLMGMPFPSAIKRIPRQNIPLAWAVNGAASVLSPVLCMLLALSMGYFAVCIVAGLLYGAGALWVRAFFAPRLS